MNPNDFSKVFDVSKPRAGANSRPMIVGHHPVMTDPMMRRPQAPSRPAHPQAPQHDPGSPKYQQAKSIEVSEEMRHNIISATTPLAHLDPSLLEEKTIPEPPSQPMHTTVQPPAQLAVPAPAAPAAPAIPASPDVFNAPAAVPTAPQQPANEPHFHSLPLSHQSVTSPGRLKRLIVWLVVLALLAAIAAYLIIDAGLISNNINLPFHIFNQQS